MAVDIMYDKIQKGGLGICRIYVRYFDEIDHVTYKVVGEAYKVVNKYFRTLGSTPKKFPPGGHHRPQ